MKPWIRVMVKMNEHSFQYDRTQNPSWADHLMDCARREYPGAEDVFKRVDEERKK